MNTEVNLNTEVSLNTEADIKRQPAFLISVGVLLLMFIASYYQPLIFLVEQWITEPDYIYGFFIVPFSIFLLWDRREMLKETQVQFCVWGIPVMILGIAMSWYAGYKFRLGVDAGTMVITLSGLVLLVGGWQLIRWAWPGIVFLFFMVPLPGYISTEFRNQLQEICTRGSVFILQTLGVSAIQQGNAIELPNANPLGVVDACSGLRTLMLFFAACTGAALYVRRHAVIKLIMIVSAVPIAIFCNTIRITATALIHMINEEAGKLTHDLAGLVMMPMAIALLWLELTLIEKLFLTGEDEHRPLMGESSAQFGVPQDRTRSK